MGECRCMGWGLFIGIKIGILFGKGLIGNRVIYCLRVVIECL